MSLEMDFSIGDKVKHKVKSKEWGRNHFIAERRKYNEVLKGDYIGTVIQLDMSRDRIIMVRVKWNDFPGCENELDFWHQPKELEKAYENSKFTTVVE